MPVSGVVPSARLGFVAERFEGDATRKVILIQDLHAHLDTQKKIIGLLGFYESQGLLQRPVAIEGATGPWDLTKLAQFPNAARRQELDDYLLREAGLSGPEWFALKTGRPTLLTGVDSQPDVEIQRHVFSKTLTNRTLAAQQMRTVLNVLSAMEQKEFKGKLRHWLKLTNEFNAGEIYGDVYLRKIASVGGRLGLDPQTPVLRRALQSKTSEDIAELSTQDQFYTDLRAYAQAVGIHLARRPSDANLIKAHFAADLLHRLFRQQLTLSEIRLLSHRQQPLAQLSSDLMAVSDHGRWFNVPSLLELIRASTDFYVAALVRDEPLADNITTLLSRPRSASFPGKAGFPETVIAVAGGFHTRGITAVLRQKGVSYEVITPNITAPYTSADQARYAARLAGEPVSLEGLNHQATRSAHGDTSEIASPQSRTLNALLSVPEKFFGRTPVPGRALPKNTVSLFGPAAVAWFDALRQSLSTERQGELPTYRDALDSIGLSEFQTLEFDSDGSAHVSMGALQSPIFDSLVAFNQRFGPADAPFPRVSKVHLLTGEVTPVIIDRLVARLGVERVQVDNIGNQLALREELPDGSFAVWTHADSWSQVMPFLVGPQATEDSRLLIAGIFLGHEHLEDHYDNRLSPELLTHEWLQAHGDTFAAVVDYLENGSKNEFADYLNTLLQAASRERILTLRGTRIKTGLRNVSVSVNGDIDAITLRSQPDHQTLKISRIDNDAGEFLVVGDRTYRVLDPSSIVDLDALMHEPSLWLGNPALVKFYGFDKGLDPSGPARESGLKAFAANYQMQPDLLPPPIDASIVKEARDYMKQLASTLMLMNKFDVPMLSKAQQFHLLHAIGIVGGQTGPHPGKINELEPDTADYFDAQDILTLFRGEPRYRSARLDESAVLAAGKLGDYLTMVQYGVDYEQLADFGRKITIISEIRSLSHTTIDDLLDPSSHKSLLTRGRYAHALHISDDKVKILLKLARTGLAPEKAINLFFLQPEIEGVGDAIKLSTLPREEEIPARPIRSVDDLLKLGDNPIVRMEDLQFPEEPGEDLGASMVSIILAGGAATRFGGIPKLAYRVIKIQKRDGSVRYLSFLEAKQALAEGLSRTGEIAQWITTSYVAELDARKLFAQRDEPLAPGSYITRQDVSWRFVPGSIDPLLYDGGRLSLTPGIGHASNLFQILLHPEMLLEAEELGHVIFQVGNIDNIAQRPRASIIRAMLAAAKAGHPLSVVLEISKKEEKDEGGIPVYTTYNLGSREREMPDLREGTEYLPYESHVPVKQREYQVQSIQNRYFNPLTPWFYGPSLLTLLGVLDPADLTLPYDRLHQKAILRLRQYVEQPRAEILKRARSALNSMVTYLISKDPTDSETKTRYKAELPERMIQNYLTRMLPGKKMFARGARSGPDNIFTPAKDINAVVDNQEAWAAIFNGNTQNVLIDGVPLTEIGVVVPMDRNEIEIANAEQAVGLGRYFRATEAVDDLRREYHRQRTREGQFKVMQELQNFMMDPNASTRSIARAVSSLIVTANRFNVESMLSQEDRASEVLRIYQNGKPEVKSVIWAILESNMKMESDRSNGYKAAAWVESMIKSPATDAESRNAPGMSGQRNSRRWVAVTMGILGVAAMVSVAYLTSLAAVPTVAAAAWGVPQVAKFFGHGNADYENGVIKGAVSNYQRQHESLHLFLNGEVSREAVIEVLLTPILFWEHEISSLLAWLRGTLRALFRLGPPHMDALMSKRIEAMERYLGSGTVEIQNLVDQGIRVSSMPSQAFASYLRTVHEQKRLDAYDRARQKIDILTAA